MEPCWRPDPTGRHDYRWWTGVSWSDQVGDAGRVTIDPEPAPRPLLDRARRSNREVVRRRLAVAAAVVVIIGFGVATVELRGQSIDDGLGDHRLELLATDGVVEHDLVLAQGEVVRIRVEPSPRLDTRVLVLADESTGRATAAILAARPVRFGGGDDADAVFDRSFADAGSVLTDPEAAQRFGLMVVLDELGTGRVGGPDTGRFAAAVAGTYSIVIEAAGTQRSGPLRLIIEEYDQRFDPATDDPEEFFDVPFFTDAEFFRSATPYKRAD